MTEDEARTKWCPMVRVGSDAGCNRSGVNFPHDDKCIASDCMMWRKFYRTGVGRADIGYCGLAGAPEA